jgi:asparagine synthase (glutamine-hydrolysing)
MCGIAGEIVLQPGRRVVREAIPAMASLIAHRGSDDWGYVVDPRDEVLLLNTRLSIVDLAGGRQPLANEDQTIWVTLNGECYGFEEQARSLESRGHRFRTRTDTEVLVHLYEELGEGFVDRLRGEYAFALHDRRRGVCYLVRDRFGVKPLVYTVTGPSLVFASEVKALLAHPGVTASLDEEQIFHTFGGIFIPDRTFFRGIRQVEPASIIRIDVGAGLSSPRRYWDFPFPRHQAETAALSPRAEADAIDGFRDALYEATRVRLHGDVEVGAYLSGGVDSATIVHAARAQGARMHAFTVGFEGAGYDETARAAEVARGAGVEHHVVRIGAGDLADPFVGSVWHAEAPVINAHGAAKFLLSRLARSAVKVVLTGEGADELLAGYPQFRHQSLLAAAQRAPADPDARRALAAFTASAGVYSGIVQAGGYVSYDEIVARFGAYPYALLKTFVYQGRLRWLVSAGFRDRASGYDTLTALERALGPRAFDGLDPIAASQYLLFRTELPGYILVSLGDREEMAHGVEGRVPFLDHHVVERACALPLALKMRGDENKYILRRLLADVAPEAAARPKQIFLAPSTTALGLDRRRSPLDAWLDGRIVREAGIFNPATIWALRRLVRLATPGSRLHAGAEAVIVFALSVHLLHDLFCRDFASARRRFAPDPARFDLVAGNVERQVPRV